MFTSFFSSYLTKIEKPNDQISSDFSHPIWRKTSQAKSIIHRLFSKLWNILTSIFIKNRFIGWRDELCYTKTSKTLNTWFSLWTDNFNTRSSHWCQKRNYHKYCVTTSHGCLSLLYLLIEIAVRNEGIADEVNELEGLADFACNGLDLKDYEGIVGQISYSFWDVERS